MSSKRTTKRLLILDTDHLSEWEGGSAAGIRLRARLTSASSDLAVTVVTVEEQMRGWLAEIHRHRDLHRQIPPVEKLSVNETVIFPTLAAFFVLWARPLHEDSQVYRYA